MFEPLSGAGTYRNQSLACNANWNANDTNFYWNKRHFNFLKTLKPVENYYFYFNLKIIKNILTQKSVYKNSHFLHSGFLDIYFDDFMTRI